MSLRERIEKDFTDALKARDERRLSALRLFKTDLKKREVSGPKKELTDAEAAEADIAIAQESLREIAARQHADAMAQLRGNKGSDRRTKGKR